MIEMRVSTTKDIGEQGEEPFVSVPQAAGLLHVSQATIWRWVEAGRLPAYRIGPRRIRIKRRDLETVVSPVKGKGSPEVSSVRDKGGIWAGYDPGKVREALRESAGAFAGIDADAFIAEIHAARGQASRGRPE